MTRVKLNRSLNLLAILTTLILVGCSDSAKQSLNLSESAPIISPQEENSSHHKHHNLHLHRASKTASNHKNTVWERMLSLYS